MCRQAGQGRSVGRVVVVVVVVAVDGEGGRAAGNGLFQSYYWLPGRAIELRPADIQVRPSWGLSGLGTAAPSVAALWCRMQTADSRVQ